MQKKNFIDDVQLLKSRWNSNQTPSKKALNTLRLIKKWLTRCVEKFFKKTKEEKKMAEDFEGEEEEESEEEETEEEE